MIPMISYVDELKTILNKNNAIAINIKNVSISFLKNTAVL